MKLDRAITLLKPQRTTDTQGGARTTYVPVAVVPANVEPMLRPSQQAAAGANRWFDAHKITIRYRADIAANWHIQYRGRRFKLEHTPAEKSRGDFLVMTVTAFDPNPAGVNTALTQ